MYLGHSKCVQRVVSVEQADKLAGHCNNRVSAIFVALSGLFAESPGGACKGSAEVADAEHVCSRDALQSEDYGTNSIFCLRPLAEEARGVFRNCRNRANWNECAGKMDQK